MPKSLEGVRVLDLGRIVSAPWCAQTLVDLGADAITIERPGRGDDLRTYGPSFGRDPECRQTTESGHYICSNRNKRAVTADLSTTEGQAIVRGLAERSDVLLKNCRGGDLAGYKPDYASLSALNPGLVYCSITGFGQDGPYSARPGYDAVFQGMSGLMAVTGEPDGLPQRIGVHIIDDDDGHVRGSCRASASRYWRRSPELRSRSWTSPSRRCRRAQSNGCSRASFPARLMACCIPAAPTIYRANEMMADAQVLHHKLHFEVPYPTAGSVPTVASPIRMSKTPVDEHVAPQRRRLKTTRWASRLIALAMIER